MAGVDDATAGPESVHSATVHAHISHAVIATYAADAAGEVDGVYALLGGHFGSLDRRTDPERAAKAVRVTSRGEGVALDVHVLVEWRASIPDVVAGVTCGARLPLVDGRPRRRRRHRPHRRPGARCRRRGLTPRARPAPDRAHRRAASPVCQSCVWWQSRPYGRAVNRASWIEDVEGRFGPWGKVYVDHDRHVGSLQYGPADAFPRGRSMPAGPPSSDAVLVTCAFLTDPTSPWALQSLFLACIGESRDRGAAAVEAFGYRYGRRASSRRASLSIAPSSRATSWPTSGSSAAGAGRVELMRLELGGLVPVEEPRALVEEASPGRARSLSRPAPGRAVGA